MRKALKRAAAAPSTTRWSQLSDSGSISRGWNALPSHTGSVEAAADAEDRDLGRVDDRREVAPADPAQRRDREAPAAHVGRRELAVARLLRQLAHLGGDLQHALLVGVLDHRHDQAVRRVGGEADVEVLLQHQMVALQAGVELGELLQRGDAGLDQEGEHRHLDARLLVLLVGRDPERLELGDVGVVVIGDVRDHDPVAMQHRAADLLDPRQLLLLDRPELGEVDLRPGRQAGEGPAARGGARGRRLRRLGLGRLRSGHHRLDEGLDIFLGDAALRPAAFHLGQRHAELAGELPDRRRGMRQGALRRGRLVRRQRRRRDRLLPVRRRRGRGRGGRGRSGRRRRRGSGGRSRRPARRRRRLAGSRSHCPWTPCRRP